MMLELQKHTMQIEYLPGHRMNIADALSRDYLLENNSTSNDKEIIGIVDAENEIRHINLMDGLCVSRQDQIDIAEASQ